MSDLAERLARFSRSSLQRRFVLGEVLGPVLQIYVPPRGEIAPPEATQSGGESEKARPPPPRRGVR